MIDESNLLNFYCSGIYDSTKALTETEIIMKVLEKLNLVILNFNNLESQTLNNIKTLDKQVNYYLDSGMKIELSKKLDEMVNDGTFSSIINQQIFEDLNNQILENIDNISALESKVDTNKRETDEIISDNKQLFDNFKTSVEEFIQAYNEYKQTLDATISDVQEIKEMNNTVNNVNDLRQALLKGGTIYIEPGIYYVPEDNPLCYTSFTTVIGKGEVIIKLNPNSNNFIMVKPALSGTEGGYALRNIKFENIIFDGQNSTKNAGLLATCHCKYVTIKNCEFRNLKSSWHFLEINSSYSVDIEGCIFTDYNYGVSDSIRRTECLQLDYAGSYAQYPFDCLYDNTKCKNININNCKFERITTSETGAIGSHTKYKDYMPEDVTIKKCEFYDVDICVFAPDYHNLIVNECTARNVASFIVVEPSDDSGKCTSTITNNVYDGWNRCKKIGYMNDINEGRFFFALNHGYWVKDTIITDNKIFNAYSHGIGITLNGGNISNNIVKYSGKNGIYLYGGQQVSINGNSCVGNGTLNSGSYKDIMINVGSKNLISRCNITGNASYVSTDGKSYDATIIANNLG